MKNLFWGLLSVSAALALSACSTDTLDEASSVPANSAAAAKLIHSSQSAATGKLLVYFNEEGATSAKGLSLVATRAGEVATRSGIEAFDMVLNQVGVQSIEPLFVENAENAERLRAAGMHRWYLVRFDEQVNLDEAALAMAEVGEVERVEFAVKVKRAPVKTVVAEHVAVTPSASSSYPAFNDPQLDNQWHYINKGNTTIYSKIKADADVNCDEAWPYSAGDPRVVVAVVDGGVDYSHHDLSANMWVNTAEKNGQTGVDDDGNGFVDDIYGFNFSDGKALSAADDHGTHVAGTVAAVNNNNTGVCGVAGGTGNNDGARIMSCQIFSDGNGSGTIDVTVRAFQYAADNGACILQCSFGYDSGYITSDTEFARLCSAEIDAVTYFTSKQNCSALSGGLAIFAAGNESGAMSSYPGAYKDFISVTAMSCDYTPAYYTNYGPGCNIAAPGGDLYQANKAGVLSTMPKHKYGYMQGTSMACPHVSGVAALGLSYALKLGKTFTLDQYKAILLTSVNDINPYCTGSKTGLGDISVLKGKMGSGYIDAFQVMMNVRGTTCIPIVASASQQQVDVMKYIAQSGVSLTLADIEISATDMQKLGMTAAPKVFGGKVLLTCPKTGSAILKVKLTAGTNSGKGISGMTVTKEIALISRATQSTNGGWF